MTNLQTEISNLDHIRAWLKDAVDEFLARNGVIRVVPMGVSGEREMSGREYLDIQAKSRFEY